MQRLKDESRELEQRISELKLKKEDLRDEENRFIEKQEDFVREKAKVTIGLYLDNPNI